MQQNASGVTTMEILNDDIGRMKVILSSDDLKRFGLTYEQVDYQNQKTKNMFRELLCGARQLVGFLYDSTQMLIEVFPAPAGGCVVYFSALETEKPSERRLKLKHKTFSPQIYRFDCSEDLLCALNAVSHFNTKDLQSELYLLDDQYYLVLWASSLTPFSVILSEYAAVEKSPIIMAAFLNEHAQSLAAPDALGKISKAFL